MAPKRKHSLVPQPQSNKFVLSSLTMHLSRGWADTVHCLKKRVNFETV